MMKRLYVLVAEGGDGSYYPQYTFNTDWILQKAREFSVGTYGYPEMGCDGDGFHYDELWVHESVTLKSLGVNDCAED